MSTVLILGASSDISLALAREFAAHKYNVQLAARNIDATQAIASDIRIRSGVDCTAHHFDATKFADHAGFFNSLPVKPDVTICVFGVMYEEDEAWADWQKTQAMIDTNFTGAVSILNVVSKYYEAQKKGVIAGISSVAGERGRQSKLIYGASKAAFTAYLDGLRNKLFASGVHVVTVKPGFVNTKMTEDLKLSKPLTAEPVEVAKAVYKAVQNKQNTVYTKWMWRYIMLIIKNIPEPMFKKMNL
jgi:decaprenylphospho-beta-D-erythro-pentofuranosid-2-ulose 2-reductase